MIGNEEVRRTDDSNLITEFHNEQKIQNDSSLDVISSPPPREALVSDIKYVNLCDCLSFVLTTYSDNDSNKFSSK